MVSAITSRVANLQNHASAGVSRVEDDDDDDDKHGVRVVTLAGNNTGATMRSDSDDVKPGNAYDGLVSAGEKAAGAEDALSTYVNSNFQAVNNSIMLESSYSTNDPGVHLEISDVPEVTKGGKKGGGMKEKHQAKTSHDQSDEQSD
ncbi:uncharacterized protein LOC110813694 [Carica papaya]|uniref:uncharacterized protein LOC110813694 n=1 Tax=Carica papaya TaxID=3649 RepID=UPI000B8CFDA4|nr:uncharacterized protein LOC110813694 [Carica papaya]